MHFFFPFLLRLKALALKLKFLAGLVLRQPSIFPFVSCLSSALKRFCCFFFVATPCEITVLPRLMCCQKACVSLSTFLTICIHLLPYLLLVTNAYCSDLHLFHDGFSRHIRAEAQRDITAFVYTSRSDYNLKLYNEWITAQLFWARFRLTKKKVEFSASMSPKPNTA